jgi:translation initiation factor 1A
MQKQTQQEEKNDFGDFEEIKEEGKKKPITEQSEQEQQAPQRIRMPRNKELIGLILQRLGGNRMDIKTTDGKTRNCRVPGRYRRRLWLRPKDIVIIIPWEYDDGKGDVIYKYPPVAVKQLRRKGILNSLKEEF